MRDAMAVQNQTEVTGCDSELAGSFRLGPALAAEGVSGLLNF